MLDINSVRDLELYSMRTSEVLRALYKLGGRKELPPDAQEIAQMLLLLRHSDAEVREVAAEAVGIRWRLKEAYPILKNMAVREEKDQSVLTTVCAALGILILKGIGELDNISKILALISLNMELDHILRGTAYLFLKRMHKIISPKDSVSLSHNIEELDFDKEWVKSLI